MKSSALRENILIQSADYKYAKQNELMQRYIFKPKNKGETDALPYTLITQKASSHYLKKKMNQQVKLAILDAERMGICISDILYKLKEHRSSQASITNELLNHYPFDTKFDTLNFFELTGKFINVYQILSDGTMKKINPLIKYDGITTGLKISILGTNSINIEFYGNGTASEYMVEILSCVDNYSQISYSDFMSLKSYANTILFMNGIMMTAEAIKSSENKANVEIFDINGANILYDTRVKITDNRFDFYNSPGYISSNLIVPYGKDGEFYQRPLAIEQQSEQVPNTFLIRNFDSWKSYQINEFPSDNNYIEGEYYKNKNGNIFLYSGYLRSINTVSIDTSKVYMSKNINEPWVYSDEQWIKATHDNISKTYLSSDYTYIDTENDLIWLYSDDGYVNMLVLGDRDIFFKSDHESIYDKLLPTVDYDNNMVACILDDIFENLNDDSKLLLSYPDYYREILENKVKDELYIKTLDFIKRNQIITFNGEYYVKFTFPIKSFSFMIFLNGKLIVPDMYDENQLDMSIYIMADKILDVSTIKPMVPDKWTKPALSNYTHREISKMKYNEIDNVYVHQAENTVMLTSPLTIVRCKSFHNEANRFSLEKVPLYLKKSEYDRYIYENDKYVDTESDDIGDYIYYNDRYYTVSDKEYIYNIDTKSFESVDGAGEYYEIMVDMIKAPYNKHLENNLNNLIFAKEHDSYHQCKDCGFQNENLMFECENCGSKNITYINNSEIIENVTLTRVQANSAYPYQPQKMPTYDHNWIVSGVIPTNDNTSEFGNIKLYNADIGYSEYHTSSSTDDSFELPFNIKYNYDQVMLFTNGYNISDFYMDNTIKLHEHNKKSDKNDIFIVNAAKLRLYQTIRDLTLYENMTIELADAFYDIDKDYVYRKYYKKNTDIVHCPLSLKYMMIFVNGIYMDKNHVSILSNRRFMLTHLEDFSEIKTNDDGQYIIDSIDIYMYPFELDKTYLDYYRYPITYKDDKKNIKYREYPINDILYDNCLSELVSSAKTYCNKIVFEGDNLKDPGYYYLSDFRQIALSKFTHDELSKMRHDRYGSSLVMSGYTHDELSKFTHDELVNYIHQNPEKED